MLMLLFQLVPRLPSPSVPTSLFSSRIISTIFLDSIYIALIYNTCFSLSDLLHSVSEALGSFTSLQLTHMHSFLWLSNIPLYKCTTASLSIHLLMASRLLPCPGYCKYCCIEHWGTCVFQNCGFSQCMC